MLLRRDLSPAISARIRRPLSCAWRIAMQIDSSKRITRLRIALRVARSSIWSSIFFAGTANAQTYRQMVSTEYVFAADRSFTYTVHSETTPLTQSVLQGASQLRYSVNGNQTFEVVEAYTRKSDGQQIAVSPSEIVSQDGVVGPLLSYADIKIRQIPFKNVAAGDTVLATVRYRDGHHRPGEGLRRSAPPAPQEEAERYEMTGPRPPGMRFFPPTNGLNNRETPAGEMVAHHWSGHFQIPQSTEQNVADLASR